jgi:flagellar biosynthesis protein FlhG
VLLFDADLGLANVDIALGLKPQRDIQHVVSGEYGLDEVLMTGPEGIHVVPAASGVAKMAALSSAEQAGLVRAFSDLQVPVSTLLVDTGAGIDRTVLTFAAACSEVIVVVCDEPTSRADAYALIKVLNQQCNVKRFQLLANMVESDVDGRKMYRRLSEVCDRFLDVHLGYLGAVPQDDYLRRAVKAKAPVVCQYPRSPSASALVEIAATISRMPVPAGNGGLGFFMERLVEFRSGAA